MATTAQNEKWKDVSFGFKFTNDYRLHVSDKGNLKAFNKFSSGEPLKGSTINGYRIIRLKLYKPKDKKHLAGLVAKHQEIVALRNKIKKWKSAGAKTYKGQMAESKRKLKMMQDALRKDREQDIKNRTMHYHSLFHRLVAEYFLRQASPSHTVVGHLDYNKLNNKAGNLRWMTPEENYTHQQSSPYVIKEKKDRITKYKDHPRGAKLTVDNVRELKKMLQAGRSIRSLVKKFKVTDTQILRIKRGDNWGSVRPAK